MVSANTPAKNGRPTKPDTPSQSVLSPVKKEAASGKKPGRGRPKMAEKMARLTFYLALIAVLIAAALAESTASGKSPASVNVTTAVDAPSTDVAGNATAAVSGNATAAVAGNATEVAPTLGVIAREVVPAQGASANVLALTALVLPLLTLLLI